MAAKERITAERARELLNYDPETGVFIWRVIHCRNIPVGRPAGSVLPDGYLYVMIDGRNYKRSRLAWLYMSGEWGPRIVDHRDTDGLNDRWSNLRAATDQQNNRNTSKRSDNKSGYKGVCFSPGRKKWRANICIDGRQTHLGYFVSAEDAATAYRAAATLHFGEFARFE